MISSIVSAIIEVVSETKTIYTKLINIKEDFIGKYIFGFFTILLMIISLSFILIQSKQNALAATNTKTPYLPSKSFTYSVWVPYWSRWGGTDELLATKDIKNSNFNSSSTEGRFYGKDYSNINLNKVDILSPFTFEVNETGAFLDKGKMDQDPFKTLIKASKEKNIKIYPTVLWTDKQEMEKVLSDADLQQAILSDILFYLNKYNLDGIDIDFEGKATSTKDDFSNLLKLLSTNLHKNNKGLICTLEVRTPLYDVYEKLTQGTIKNISYSNDYSVIGKYCDNVRLMTYDQGGADISLNNKNKNIYYRPVADTEWVKRVIEKAIISGIPKKKLVLGIATYGYKFEVSTSTLISEVNNNSKDKWGSILLNNKNIYNYKRLGSMNYYYADLFAKENNIIQKRNVAGELEYVYSTTTDYSGQTQSSKTYYVTYSDSIAIKQKIDYAKKAGIAGVAIFKIDGNNDHNIWNVIK